jgi:hypothetical protein
LQALRRKDHPETLPTPAFTVAPPTLSPTAPPTWTPTATATPLPTAPPSATVTPLPTHTPTAPPSFELTGLRHERQGWNNCGPTTLGMALSYWGRPETQSDLAPLLKPDPEDKHVGAWEMEICTEDLGLDAIVRANGTLDMLKTFVQAGFPVMVETWEVFDPRDQLGHYRLVVGYDEAAQEFILYDSLEEPDFTISYRALDELWRVFNRTYMLVYPPDRWEEVATILGPNVDDATMYQRALERARYELENPPATCEAYADCADWVTFSWFNVGTSLNSLGRHAEAATAYDQARQLGLHYRMLWYQFGPYESYYAVGRYEDVIALANATLATAANLEESYLWRGKARLAQGDVAGARADFEEALRYHEGWTPALEALAELEGATAN